MAITNLSGPLIVSGQRPAVNGMVPEYNQDAGPSLLYSGCGLLDPRWGYFDHNAYRAMGFSASANIPVLDVIPFTATANNIAASQAVTAGTKMTLVSTTGTGVTVLAAATTIYPSANVIPSGALALDGVSALLTYGSSPSIAIYDPSKALSRCVSVVTNADDTGGFYTVAGYDIYGYPMTQKLTGVSSGTVTTTKAFKFVTSVIPSGTINSTAVTVGTSDTIGLPLRADFFGDLKINYPDTLVTATTGFTAAVTTSPATLITGDVRGTYVLQTASNNARHLQVFATPRPVNLPGNAGSYATTGLFGVTQV